LILVEEDQYQKIARDTDPSPEYDVISHTQTSTVSITEETRLRLLGREDSPMLFRQKPENFYMSLYLHQHFDAMDSTEGIPRFYFRYAHHSSQHSQEIVN
jgi:hypothetical protein